MSGSRELSRTPISVKYQQPGSCGAHLQNVAQPEGQCRHALKPLRSDLGIGESSHSCCCWLQLQFQAIAATVGRSSRQMLKQTAQGICCT